MLYTWNIVNQLYFNKKIIILQKGSGKGKKMKEHRIVTDFSENMPTSWKTRTTLCRAFIKSTLASSFSLSPFSLSPQTFHISLIMLKILVPSQGFSRMPDCFLRYYNSDWGKKIAEDAWKSLSLSLSLSLQFSRPENLCVWNLQCRGPHRSLSQEYELSIIFWIFAFSLLLSRNISFSPNI